MGFGLQIIISFHMKHRFVTLHLSNLDSLLWVCPFQNIRCVGHCLKTVMHWSTSGSSSLGLCMQQYTGAFKATSSNLDQSSTLANCWSIKYTCVEVVARGLQFSTAICT